MSFSVNTARRRFLLQAGAGMGAYAASKASVHRLTEALAAEWKGRITVNAVLAVALGCSMYLAHAAWVRMFREPAVPDLETP